MSAPARWCLRHRLLGVGIWAALLVALAVPYATLGSSYSDAFSLPHQVRCANTRIALEDVALRADAKAGPVLNDSLR